jgi:hypothetical protein
VLPVLSRVALRAYGTGDVVVEKRLLGPEAVDLARTWTRAGAVSGVFKAGLSQISGVAHETLKTQAVRRGHADDTYGIRG